MKGLRFQRRIKIFPGVTLVLSKSGISFSLGGRGARVNVGSTGRKMLNLGIPGTGISYRIPLGTTAFILVGILVVLVLLGLFLFPEVTKKLINTWIPGLV